MEFIHPSATDEVCKTGICSWDSLGPTGLPNLDNYYEMYSMCYGDTDNTATEASLFTNMSNEQVEKSIASYVVPSVNPACGSSPLVFKDEDMNFKIKYGSWSEFEPMIDYEEEL